MMERQQRRCVIAHETVSIERTLLVGVELRNERSLWRVEDSLDELAALADTAGLTVVGREWQRMARARAATLIGSGKLAELVEMRDELDAQVAKDPEESFTIPNMQPIFERADHLIQALGVMRYRECLPLLRTYLPTPPVRGPPQPPSLAISDQPSPRTSAYWALGRILAGESHEEFAVACIARLDPNTTEVEMLRMSAAVALGRMTNQAAVPALEAYYTPDEHFSKMSATVARALRELTGKPYPYTPPPRVLNQLNWALEPFDY